MTKKIFTFLLFNCLLFAFNQCSNPEDFGPQTNLPQDTSQPQLNQTIPVVFIANEGNFGWGANASLSVYYPDEKRTSTNFFEKITGFKLGDVAHSLHIKDSLLYIVVNNSNKIEILNIANNSYFGKIENLLSPRQVLFVNDEIWISDLYSGQIEILDRINFTTKTTIKTNDWNEGMLLSQDGNFVFTANVKAGELLKINTSTKSIESRLKIAEETTDLIADSSGNLYVMNQKLLANQRASIKKINPIDFSIVWDFELEEDANPTSLTYSQNSSTLCFLNRKSVIKLPTDAPTNDNLLMYNLDIINPYNLAYNKSTKEYYVTDAKDYLQFGALLRFTEDFIRVDETTIGIIPGDIAFWN